MISLGIHQRTPTSVPLRPAACGVVAGYEALARFDAEPFLPPDAWFAAAARFGCAAQLEARALVAALDARATLPANCFRRAGATIALDDAGSGYSGLQQLLTV